jgi:EAL domain-containing protein (putative c-di-GMP-specific phosphodiesterase class I)
MQVSDGSVTGVEALMRWYEGADIVATPDVFMARADEAGLSHELAWMSLTNSLRFSQSLGGLPIAVNITPAVLHQKEFVEMVESALRAWDTAAGTLTLELTEGALVADFEEARSRLTHLRKLGVRVSIDDFGTGYSSLSYFKVIPADELKIDKSFILRMVEDSADQRLVTAIVALAHQFDLKVVAEGVETRECLELLRSLGCDCAQGYLFAAAMDEDRLRQWLWDTRRAPGV